MFSHASELEFPPGQLNCQFDLGAKRFPMHWRKYVCWLCRFRLAVVFEILSTFLF